MAEVATNVLHNVGNVLNSVNVSSTLISERIKKSRTSSVTRVSGLIEENAAHLSDFFANDPRGKQLPGFIAQLATHLTQEQAGLLKELEQLKKNIEHIKDIVAMQQSFAKVSGSSEKLNLVELVEDALRINSSSLSRHDVAIIKEFAQVPCVTVGKHQVLQILVNLIRNAKHACEDSGRDDKQMTLRIMSGTNTVQVSVSDNGVGIPPENLMRIFSHGFTTKKNGHGFGLHSGALAAKEMGGQLHVHSDGAGRGATFTLELPYDSNSTNEPANPPTS
jgi:C4-dicarboxylate-specific signal transduction histidine kinase